MNIKKIENYSPVTSFYDVKGAAYHYVTMRMMKAFDEIDEIRSRIQTVEDFIPWQSRARKNFLDSVGALPYDSTYPLSARTIGTIEEEKLSIEKVIFSAREGVKITANLYLPAVREERSPAVILQCGHALTGKAAPAYQRAARIIANAGIIVLVIDPPGQGERSYYQEEGIDTPFVSGASSEHQQFGNQCFLVDESPVKYFLADAMRGIDYLCSRKEVDPERIGATGNSGGGTMTAALMVVDDRIKAAAPSCWPTSGREYFLTGSSPDSEQVWPDILKHHVDHYEIMACMCPKPLLLLAQEGDFVPIEGTEKLYTECRRLWELNGNSDKIEMSIGEGGHGFSETNARVAAKFFRKHLSGGLEEIAETLVKTLPEKALNCTLSGQLIREDSSCLSVFDENLRVYRERRQADISVYERKQWMLERIYCGRNPIERFHVRCLETRSENGLCAEMLLWFTQEMMPCYGVMFNDVRNLKRQVPVTICLWTGGTDSLTVHREMIWTLCSKGRAVFVVDLCAMGKCTPNLPKTGIDPGQSVSSITDKLAKSLFMLGDSLCAIRAFDLLQTIKMLREKFKTQEIELYAEGKYAVFARIAEILDDKLQISLSNEVSISQLICNKYYDTYDIAHVLMPGLGIFV